MHQDRNKRALIERMILRLKQYKDELGVAKCELDEDAVLLVELRASKVGGLELRIAELKNEPRG